MWRFCIKKRNLNPPIAIFIHLQKKASGTTEIEKTNTEKNR
jgi:hypothetical protein